MTKEQLNRGSFIIDNLLPAIKVLRDTKNRVYNYSKIGTSVYDLLQDDVFYSDFISLLSKAENRFTEEFNKL